MYIHRQVHIYKHILYTQIHSMFVPFCPDPGTPLEALVGTLKGVLKSYVLEHPKELMWKTQLDRLYHFEATFNEQLVEDQRCGDEFKSMEYSRCKMPWTCLIGTIPAVPAAALLTCKLSFNRYELGVHVCETDLFAAMDRPDIHRSRCSSFDMQTLYQYDSYTMCMNLECACACKGNLFG